MGAVNRAMSGLFDLMLRPFEGMSAWASLLPLSILFTIFALYVFKWTSNQAALDRVKRRIHAGIFEIRLFNDDLRAILRAQGEILRTNLTYLRLTLWPMLFLLPPLVLVIAQLQFHYGYEGLRPGQRALVSVDLETGAGGGERPAARLDVPAGLRAETADVWVKAESQLLWRIVAERDGDYELGLDVAGTRLTKTVRVTPKTVRLAPVRVDHGFVSQLLYPAEAPLPTGAPVRAIHLSYPEREVSVLGWPMHWMVPFFALSIAFAFALRGLFKVTI